MSDNEYCRDSGLAGNGVPLTLRAEMRKAFREWLDASKAWSALRKTVEANGDSWTARRKLEELEERVDAAAETFRQVQQRLNDVPVRTPQES